MVEEYDRLWGIRSPTFSDALQRYMIPLQTSGLGPLTYGGVSRAQRAKDWQRVISSCITEEDRLEKVDRAVSEGFTVRQQADIHRGVLSVTVTET